MTFSLLRPRHQNGYGHVSSGRSSSDGDSAEDNLLGKEMPSRQQAEKRPWWHRYALLIVAHVILFVVYTGTIYALANSVHYKIVHGPGLVTSPANDAIIYEERGLTLESRIHDMGPFAAKPSEQVDSAWHNLLNDINIEVEPEIMRHFGREDIGIRLPNKDRYVGTLNVYHQLHCVKRLHQYMYPDYYFPDFNEQQKEMNRLHSEHCIDFLRQSIMCLGDVGLITFEWSPSSLIPVANATTHQCVNWDHLVDWTKGRAVDMYKPDYLIHPKFGPTYLSDRKGEKLGVTDPKHPYRPDMNAHDSHAHGGY